jgi:uncharacterized protein (DUF2267 family)
MWYKKQLKLVRRARRLAKQQQQQLVHLELEGLLSVQLRTLTATLTLPLAAAVGAQLADVLREALRDRRQALQAEAQQLEDDWRESQALRARDKATLRAAKAAAGG